MSRDQLLKAPPANQTEETKRNPVMTVYADMILKLALRNATRGPAPRCKGCRSAASFFDAIFDAWMGAREKLNAKYPDGSWSLNSITIYEDETWNADYDLKEDEPSSQMPTALTEN